MDSDIIGIGSALVDVTVQVDDSFLEAEKLPKGGMTLVDAKRSRELLDRFPHHQKALSPGGATANVMASFAHCGGRAGFIGKVGNCELGAYFKTATEKAGVEFLMLTSDTTPTGIGMTFITPDGQRTFATYLGAAVEMSPDDLSPGLLGRAPILHLEAYLVFNRELISFILDAAESNGQRISIDLSSFDTVKENLDFLEQMAQRKLDILFANEDESHAFTGLPPRESLGVFSRLCDVAVVKEGALGSHIAQGSHQVYMPARNVIVVDTNGAGDAYAGGVLYGLCCGMSLAACGHIGTNAGALAVSQQGARLTEENARILRDFAADMDVLMMRRLEAGSLTPEMVAAVGVEIAEFHEAAEVCSPTAEHGTVESLRAMTDEDFDQTKKYIGITLSAEQYDRLKVYTESFYTDHEELLESRISQQKIRACHGDLHMEHICLGDSINILDCFDFDERFKYTDVASDVAFLAMDMDFHQRSDLSRIFVDAYVQHSGDMALLDLLTYYKAYRAYLRGKLTSSRLDVEHISSEEKKAVVALAKRYFDLAESYISKGQ